MHQHNEKHSVAVKCSNCDCVHCKECFRAHSACGDEFCESRGYYDTESCLEKIRIVAITIVILKENQMPTGNALNAIVISKMF